jgi:hypothetical protein
VELPGIEDESSSVSPGEPLSVGDEVERGAAFSELSAAPLHAPANTQTSAAANTHAIVRQDATRPSRSSRCAGHRASQVMKAPDSRQG